MASSNRSEYYFNTWESALKAAWKEAIKRELIDYFCSTAHYSYSSRYNYPQQRDEILLEFLHASIGHHLWASNPRTEQYLNVARVGALTSRFFKKAEKAKINDLFVQKAEIVQEKENLKLVYSAFMTYLSAKSTIDEKFKALLQLHTHNSVMNCERF
jgi:hypothetical protein